MTPPEEEPYPLGTVLRALERYKLANPTATGPEYRVVGIDPAVLARGGTGYKLKNTATGRRHWTSLERLDLDYRTMRVGAG